MYLHYCEVQRISGLPAYQLFGLVILQKCREGEAGLPVAKLSALFPPTFHATVNNGFLMVGPECP